MHRRQSSPTLSATDPPLNQFFFQDHHADDSPPGSPIEKTAVMMPEQIRTRALDAADSASDILLEVDRNGGGLEEGLDIAQLRLLPESILPSEDNSTANGSEVGRTG